MGVTELRSQVRSRRRQSDATEQRVFRALPATADIHPACPPRRQAQRRWSRIRSIASPPFRGSPCPVWILQATGKAEQGQGLKATNLERNHSHKQKDSRPSMPLLSSSLSGQLTRSSLPPIVAALPSGTMRKLCSTRRPNGEQACEMMVH